MRTFEELHAILNPKPWEQKLTPSEHALALEELNLRFAELKAKRQSELKMNKQSSTWNENGGVNQLPRKNCI
jgi:hypothetical protein